MFAYFRLMRWSSKPKLTPVTTAVIATTTITCWSADRGSLLGVDVGSGEEVGAGDVVFMVKWTVCLEYRGVQNLNGF